MRMIKDCLKDESKSLLKSKGLFDISSELRSYGDQNKKTVTFSQPLVTFIGQTSTEYYKILELKRSVMGGDEIVDLSKQQDAEEWSDISDETAPVSDNSIPRSLASLSNCSIEIRPPSRLSEISSDSDGCPDSISLVSIDSEDDFSSKPVDIDLEVLVIDEQKSVKTPINDNIQLDHKKSKLKRMPTFQIKRERESMEIQNAKIHGALPATRTVHVIPKPAIPSTDEVPITLHQAQQKGSNLKKKSKFEKKKKRDVEFANDGRWIEDSTTVPMIARSVVVDKSQLKLDMKDSAISITTQSTQSVIDRELPLEEISVCSADSAWLNDGVPEEISVCSADSEWLNEPSLQIIPQARSMKPSPLAYTIDDESSDLSLNSIEDWSVSPIPSHKQTSISKLKETFRKIFSKK
ncbi:hypothetical protein HK103_007066 [Boothiomyces macroporosus]|uniref:Uncharacterized protein n=1 Tax=Boothiomyces macroporosus TaxID=261099 RepID=A0AAD5UCJ4_9FUNG|nr:hypothetical protein HK103_007066 [Boothiomyces macroporosus]